jgi:hypothetical protein
MHGLYLYLYLLHGRFSDSLAGKQKQTIQVMLADTLDLFFPGGLPDQSVCARIYGGASAAKIHALLVRVFLDRPQKP